MKFFVLILLVFFMGSCQEAGKKTAPGRLQFEWSRWGQLPADSAGDPSSLGLAGPVAGIAGGKLIIGGGSNFPRGLPWEGGAKKYYDELFVFGQQQDSLVCMKRGQRLPYSLAYGANCSTGEGIVVAGGENEQGAVHGVLLLHPPDATGEMAISRLPDLPLALTNGMAAASKGKVYFAGGANKLGVSNQFYVLTLKDTSKGWQSLPTLPYPVTNGLLLATDSSIYLIGGRKRNIDSTSDLYDGVYAFDLNKQQWTKKASLPYALSAQTGLTWNDSTLLVLAGDKGKTFHDTEVLLMKIARAKNKKQKEQLVAEKNKLQESHPGFGGGVLAYHVHEDRWTETDSIPFPGQVTTTALKWNNAIIIPCGEIRAGVRTPNIIAGKEQPE